MGHSPICRLFFCFRLVVTSSPTNSTECSPTSLWRRTSTPSFQTIWRQAQCNQACRYALWVNRYDIFQASGTDVGINYFVRVLQQGAWPLSNNNLSPLAIPVELEKVVHFYEEFYGKQFNGRKLTWLHHLSNGDVKLGYLPKTYIVNMTTFQVCACA